MTSITFLGTGGGRFATIYQVRATGGMYINDGVRIHLDPGPSALMNMRRLALDPAKTDAVMISHCHPDHYADAEMLVEGMTRGGLRRYGALIGSVSALDGGEGFRAAVSPYHKSIVARAESVRPGDEVDIDGLKVAVTPTSHTDPQGVGFRFSTSSGDISYVGDSELTDEVAAAHKGSRAVIMNVTRPLKARVPKHLSTEDAAELAERTGAEVAILTHFGMKLVREGVGRQVRYIESHSKARVIAAEDLMTVQIGKTVKVTRSRGRDLVQGGQPKKGVDS